MAWKSITILEKINALKEQADRINTPMTIAQNKQWCDDIKDIKTKISSEKELVITEYKEKFGALDKCERNIVRLGITLQNQTTVEPSKQELHKITQKERKDNLKKAFRALKGDNIKATVKVHEHSSSIFHEDARQIILPNYFGSCCMRLGGYIDFSSKKQTTNYNIMVGQTICNRLDNASVKWEWNGSEGQCIKVL